LSSEKKTHNYIKRNFVHWTMVTKNPISAELFKILACPIDKADLVYTSDKSGLVCTKCKTVYPIRNGIPILLPKKKK